MIETETTKRPFINNYHNYNVGWKTGNLGRKANAKRMREDADYANGFLAGQSARNNAKQLARCLGPS